MNHAAKSRASTRKAWTADDIEEVISSIEITANAMRAQNQQNTAESLERAACMMYALAPQLAEHPLDPPVGETTPAQAQARAQKLEQDLRQTLGERDLYAQWADKLAEAISGHFSVDIGEHSNAHDPWRTALEAVESVTPHFNLATHLQRQASFSARTFGPGTRVAGITDHITKELEEVRGSCGALTEWVDVIILGFDGAWRSGATPEQIIQALVAKQARNEGRTWPDWRTAEPDKAIEHDRGPRAFTHERVYLSGPMSGLPEHNAPAFNAAATQLRAQGLDIINPAEINTDPSATWEQCLRKDLAALAGCDCLALLPGWEHSNGAHLELHIAHRLRMHILTVAELMATTEGKVAS